MTPSYDLEAARKNLPVLEEWTYLNTGTVGIMAEPVLEKHLANIARHEREGHATQADVIAGYERSRRVLAELLNVDPHDLGLNRNATDGINWVAATFPLNEDDEVITSTEEHPAMVLPWTAACRRAGGRMRFMDLSSDPDQLAESLKSVMTPHTRVIAISQVSCETGTRIPVEILREIAGPDVRILIDASQSVGQLPVDIPSLNADFVIGNGHKWLAGPKGTGFGWFSPNAIDLTPPAHYGSGTLDPRWSRDYYQVDPPPEFHFAPGASRFEYGTTAWHLYGALADAIEYQADLGWDAIFQHVRRLSTFAKQTLEEIPGVDVVTPERWEESSGIVTFTVAELQGTDVSRRLWDNDRITQRRVEQPTGVRVSVTYFTSEEDVTRLGQAVDRIARGRA